MQTQAIGCLLILILLMSQSHISPKHTAPENIREEVIKALSYYPEFRDVGISFRFKKNIRKSTMQAQPHFGSLFGPRKNRHYLILISEKFKISGKEYRTVDMPPEIMIGWLGHELGHIADYETRSSANLFWFGLRYLFSRKHIRSAERTADTMAVLHGMEQYIIQTKNFILNHADINPSYKERIRRYYLSPEEIMLLVEERQGI